MLTALIIYAGTGLTITLIVMLTLDVIASDNNDPLGKPIFWLVLLLLWPTFILFLVVRFVQRWKG